MKINDRIGMKPVYCLLNINGMMKSWNQTVLLFVCAIVWRQYWCSCYLTHSKTYLLTYA